MMNPLFFDDLRDIHGLDGISWWPLAPGYWLIIGLALLLIWFIRSWLQHGDWRVDARQQLKTLRHRRTHLTDKELVAEFSELLRRIAIARYGREACAGLYGQAWLQWLEAHDPKSFPWIDAGEILITLPYAPANQSYSIEQLNSLFRALRPWINADLPETQQRKQHWKQVIRTLFARLQKTRKV